MNILRATLSGLALTSALCFGQVSHASIMHFSVALDSAQQVPAGGGDPDGSGVADLYIDDVASTIDWSIVVNNIVLPLTGAHIHSGAVGVNGGVTVNFGGQLTGTNLFDTDLAAILANPAGYYVNLHNAFYPAGSLRGQLGVAVPEPATLALLGLGIAAISFTRRRTQASM